MLGLPTSIKVDGKEYRITNNADYRVILDVFQCLNDNDLEGGERYFAAALIFFKDLTIDNFNDVFKDQETYSKAISGMVEFCNCYQKNSVKKSYSLYDWQEDEQLIFASLNKSAGYEVRDPEKYVHWFTFMGYFNSIGEGTFSTVVSIREKIVKGEKLEKWERKFRAESPDYFKWDWRTNEQREIEDDIVKKFYHNR